jgi:hypothetical protein
MATFHTVSNESSVLFNLRQLMELEADRVHSEAEAVRTAELAADRARREAQVAAEAQRRAAEVARVESERSAALEAEQLAREREAALLRVRLEAEAHERAAQEQLAIERERIALEHARVLRRSGRGRIVIAVMGLAMAGIGAAAAQSIFPQQPTAAGVVAAGPVSANPFDERASELAALREQIAKLTSRATQTTPPAIAPAVAAPARPKPRTPPHPTHTTEGERRPSHPGDELRFDGDDKDPLGGLVLH